MRFQFPPNVIADERRICLTRIRWEQGTVGDGQGYSAKLSISLGWGWGHAYTGLNIHRRPDGFYAWICVLPFFPIRLSYQRSYGGTFP